MYFVLKIKNIKIILIVLGLLLLAVGGYLLFKQQQSTLPSIFEGRVLMDTEIDLTLYGLDTKRLNTAKIGGFQLVENIDKLSNALLEDPLPGSIAWLNSSPETTNIAVDPDVLAQISVAKEYYLPSNREYNIGLLKLSSLFKQSALEDRLPTTEEINTIIAESNLDQVTIDLEQQTISRPLGTYFDLGSTGKGYSADRLYDYLLTQKSVQGALINAGGTIKVLGLKGSKEEDAIFKIGLQSPDAKQEIIGTVSLTDNQSLATSGDYYRYYTIKGQNFSHILSGTEGFPKTYFKSVSICTSSALNADILSTVLYLIPQEDGQKLLESLPFKAEALWITSEGKILKTPGFEIQFKELNKLEGGYFYEEK